MSLSLLGLFASIGIWIGSTAVTVVGLAILFLLVNSDHEDPSGALVAAGVLLMLFSSWSWAAEWYQAMAGIAPFLFIWLIPDEEEKPHSVLGKLRDDETRMSLAVSTPFTASLAFLLLTWVLLTVEIDGTNLAAHELYGAPFLAVMALALSWYSIGGQISTSQGTVAVSTVLALSISLPLMSGSIPLPGDPELEITPSISRGELSVFILVWLVVALLTAGYRLMKTVSSSTQNRILLGSHMAHLGIVVLLVGHVLTTTLVDRSDPSHLVTLDKGEPLEHQGLELVFQDVQVFSSDDEEYVFAIGD